MFGEQTFAQLRTGFSQYCSRYDSALKGLTTTIELILHG